MCMSEAKPVGEITDPEDKKSWQFICPTNVKTCQNLEDCTVDGKDDDGFCCRTSIKFPEGHTDKVDMCIPKKGTVGAQANKDLQATPVGDYFMKATYTLQAKQYTTDDSSDFKLAYSYKCPSMLADCEAFEKN